jgi:hypothetical protein
VQRTTLADTLIELARAVQAPSGAGLTVTEALIELPLEVWTGTGREGMVLYAAPPHSRWRAGVLPPVHMTRMEFALVEEAACGR